MDTNFAGYYRDRARALWGPGRAEVLLGSGHADRLVSVSSVRVVGGDLVLPDLDPKFFAGEGSWLGLRSYRNGKSGQQLVIPLWVPVVWDRDELQHGVLRLDRERLPWLHRASFRPLVLDAGVQTPAHRLLLGAWTEACAQLAPLWESWATADGEVLWQSLLSIAATEADGVWSLPEGSSWIWEPEQWVFRIRDRSAGVGEGFASLGNERVGSVLLRQRLPIPFSEDEEGHRLTSFPGIFYRPEQDRWLRASVDVSLSERTEEFASGAVVPLSGVPGSGKTTALVGAVLERWARSLVSDIPLEPVLWVVRDTAEAVQRLTRLEEELGRDLRWLPNWDVMGTPQFGVFLTNRSVQIAEVLGSSHESVAATFPLWAGTDGVLDEPTPFPRQDRVEGIPVRNQGGIRRSVALQSRDLGPGVTDLEAVRWDRDWAELLRLRESSRVPGGLRVDVWEWMRDGWTQRENEKILLQTGRLFLRAVRRYAPEWIDEFLSTDAMAGASALAADLSDVSEGLQFLLGQVQGDILAVERLHGSGVAWKTAGGLEGMVALADLEKGRRALLGYRTEVASLLDLLWLESDLRVAGQDRERVSTPTRETVGNLLHRLRKADREGVSGFLGDCAAVLSCLESWSADTREHRPLAEVLVERVSRSDRLHAYLALRDWEGVLARELEDLDRRSREAKAGLPSSWSETGEPLGSASSVDAAGLRAAERLSAWVAIFQAVGFALPELEAAKQISSWDSPLWWADDGMRQRWLDSGFRAIAFRLASWLGECRFVQAAVAGRVDRQAAASLLPIWMVTVEEAGEWLGRWRSGPALVVWDDADRVSVDRGLPILSPARVAWVGGSTRDRFGVWGRSDSELPEPVAQQLQRRHGVAPQELGTGSLFSWVGASGSAVLTLPPLLRLFRGGEVLQDLLRRLSPSGVGGEDLPLAARRSAERGDWVLGGATLPPVFHQAVLGPDLGLDLGLSGPNTNEVEADALARWLRARQDDLQEDEEFGEELIRMVLVLTPYAEQVPVLKRALVVHGVDRIFVGTEPPLGSAGYPLVLVSTVQQSREVRGVWGLDRVREVSAFWLDAVSLATRSVGIFGDPKVLRSWMSSEGSIRGALDRVRGWRGAGEIPDPESPMLGQVFRF